MTTRDETWLQMNGLQETDVSAGGGDWGGEWGGERVGMTKSAPPDTRFGAPGISPQAPEPDGCLVFAPDRPDE